MNCRLCRDGELIEGDQLVVSDDTGLILHRTGYIGGDAVDLEDGIIAPGFLELQTNGMRGFHFTHFEDEKQYASKIDEVSKYLVTQGVTGFWATIPTVSGENWKKVGLCSVSLHHVRWAVSAVFEILRSTKCSFRDMGKICLPLSLNECIDS